ncbi:MAG TPA: DUF5916 domain-containing protein [Candidatus Deferrimicrobium sp.]|nr:DUF5916 domain-containing protein [Candidatus Deferrimicrobium sp.]
MKKNYFRVIMAWAILVLLCLVFCPDKIDAKPGEEEDKIIYAPAAAEKPRIDGILDEPIWQNPPLKKEFITYIPIYGEKLPYETQCWVAYDTNNLYFAFQCFDPEPEQIKTSLTKRDNIFGDDWVSVSIDATGTGQTAYVLYVNPSGIQGDALSTIIGSDDIAPDFVWQSAAKITAKGYGVEIALPLKSIRFKSGEEVAMGTLFQRKITRVGYTGSWPDIKLGHNLLGSQAKAVFKDLKKQLRLEVLPSLTHSNNRERVSPDQWGKSDSITSFGVDLKYGITSAITADVTINPDFSQVESDSFQVEVNQRYPLFYDEKRHFFMEGADIFKFYTFPNGFFTVPVHTRRIIDPRWGAKITGNVGQITFGLLSAGDQWPGQVWGWPANPNEGKSAFFGIARGKYSFGGQDNNYVGFLYSGREFAGRYNRVLGADVVYRLGKNQRISSSFLHSLSGNEDGRQGNAKDSNNFNLVYNFDSKLLLINAALEHIGTNFRMDTAYMQRIGINNYLFRTGIAFYPAPEKISWLKMISPDLIIRHVHDLYTRKDDFQLNTGLYFFTTKEGILFVANKFVTENWQGLEFKLHQGLVYGEIRLNKWLRFGGKLTFGDMIYYEGEPPIKGKGRVGTFFMELQPNQNLYQNFSFVHSDLSHAGAEIYNENIFYSNTTYQFNKYFFLRAIVQYDSYWKVLLTDFLASFTLIPGTVLHVGYGGLNENRGWQDGQWLYRQGDMINTKRSFFVKVGYLWRI